MRSATIRYQYQDQENICYLICSTVLFILSLRGCAVLEDAETDAIEAGAEEVNIIDEES